MPAPEANAVSGQQAVDLAAFCQAVESFRIPLIAYIYGLTGRREEAEELAQEAFCRAWEHLPSLRRRDRLADWLYRIAHNLVMSASRRSRAVTLLDRPGRANSPLETAPYAEVHQAVASLPEGQRLVVSLRHFAGLSQEEVARRLQIAPGTVRSRLSRAYDRLRPVLAHLLEE